MQFIKLIDKNALPSGIPAVSTERVPYRCLRGAYILGTSYARGDEVTLEGYLYLSLEDGNTETPSPTSPKWMICNIESEDWKAVHEWNATGKMVRFKNPDGSWGAWANLEGPRAPQVQYQYSPDGATEWTPAWTTQKWQRVSVDGGITWSDPQKFIGDDGEVAGPGSSTNGNFASFSGTDGKTLEDSGKSASDFASADHNHDSAYAVKDHNHDSAYAVKGHNHDSAYATKGHNHDSAYATKDHNHDGDYAPLAGWETFESVIITSAAGFSVVDNAVNQAVFVPGRPLRVGSTYQIVASYTSGVVVLSGAALTSSTEYTVSYGDFTRVVKIDINLPGKFAESATTTAIKDQTGDPLYWDLGPGKLCAVKSVIQTADSTATATQPTINVSLGGVGALVADAETGTTRQTAMCNADVEYGDVVEIEVAQATGGTPAHDAEDLSVSLLFVLV